MMPLEKRWNWQVALLWIMTLAITTWLYAPGVHGPFLFDDLSSVVSIRVIDTGLPAALDAIMGDRSGALGRPVSIASFVAQELFLDDTSTTAKSLNIVLHLVNGCLVFGLIYQLLTGFKLPNSALISALTAGAWMVSPLYVSTVLYVVQRMAMLSTFFALLVVNLYLFWRFRSDKSPPANWVCILVGVMLLALATLSKENGILILPIIMVFEALFFSATYRFKAASLFEHRPGWFLLLAGAALASLAGAGVLANHFLSSYQYHPFSLTERVLTEARVLWDYVAQLLKPEVQRMGIYHDDIVLSKSLWEPISTVWAVFCWIGIFAAGLIASKKRQGRLLFFCLCFFLIGHIAESSIFPLELYFEHRNYLPGIALFLAIAVIVSYASLRWPEIAKPLFAWITVCNIFLLSQASSQVQIWSSEPLLRLNSVIAHPNSPRANIDMASQMSAVGEIDAAIEYSRLAHLASVNSEARVSENTFDHQMRDLALTCYAQDPVAARKVLDRANNDPAETGFTTVRNLRLIVGLLEAGQCPDFPADELSQVLAEKYLSKASMTSEMRDTYVVLATFENFRHSYERAYSYLSILLASNPRDIGAQLMQLHFATALEKPEEANDLMSRLETSRAQGLLTVAQQQILSLYTEN